LPPPLPMPPPPLSMVLVSGPLSSGPQSAKQRGVCDLKHKLMSDIENSLFLSRWKHTYLIKAGWVG
jgi:hypothetical protein